MIHSWQEALHSIILVGHENQNETDPSERIRHSSTMLWPVKSHFSDITVCTNIIFNTGGVPFRHRREYFIAYSYLLLILDSRGHQHPAG
jgi:hypothetical protein